MHLKEYFENSKGTGVLSTADSEGKVNAAIYSRPHVMDDGSIAMIMTDRLSHKNLESNPYAFYLFREDADGYKGVRLSLKKIREEKNSDLIDKLRRKTYEKDGDKYLVYFEIVGERPLVGE